MLICAIFFEAEIKICFFKKIIFLKKHVDNSLIFLYKNLYVDM